MGSYKDLPWYQELSASLISMYGDVPPPWVYAPNFHPNSMGWRMGGGEAHIMVLYEWLEGENFDFDQKVAYLKKYPAPARWYAWIIYFLWQVETMHFKKKDFIPYFEELAALEFDNTADYFKDIKRRDLY